MFYIANAKKMTKRQNREHKKTKSSDNGKTIQQGCGPEYPTILLEL